MLTVRNLSVTFGSSSRRAVDNVSFDLNRGETLALVGESGSGKSVTALSLLQLLPYPHARHAPSSSIRLFDTELIGQSTKTLHHIRGNLVSMVFQEPMSSLNPLHSIERQIGEVLKIHKGLSGLAMRRRILELLSLVGLPEAGSRLHALPDQLSGGQRQRVMIAMALANEPDLLIADEPTTALDVTIQAQILKLLKDLQTQFGMAILFITHDLSIVRKVADRVCVMQEGRMVEQAPLLNILTAPTHPATRVLLAAEPTGAPVQTIPSAPEVMMAAGLRVWFPLHRGLLRYKQDYIKAVDDVSITIREGHTVGVVGESGSGKTTLGKALLRLISSKGLIRFMQKPIDGLTRAALRPLRRRMQIVFQDPYGSLNPRLSVGQIIGEGLRVHGIGTSHTQRRLLISEALETVKLKAEMQDRYPHEFSGGQRQRIAIARVLVLKPSFIVLDEPTSSLDVSIQSQIITLLRDLQRRHRLTYMFISHDLRVVRALADYIVVMQAGRVVEAGTAARLFTTPEHPYTRALIAAALNDRDDWFYKNKKQQVSTPA
ncbi:Oligopeptide transport system permease protein OppB (TC 3.A.1.5.1) [invertebrate metagenome]|uniref:Oligopeptide transport system permease protein OppB (TC 3.A.1.5.1) n=1 Tax=invertebrate metagenome TaxID=1711999 RepID=A0A484H6L9_9ZZZZ